MIRHYSKIPAHTLSTLLILMFSLNACVSYDPLLGGGIGSKPTSSSSTSRPVGSRSPAATRPPLPPGSTVPPVSRTPTQPTTTSSVPPPEGPAAFLLEEAKAHQRNGDLPAAAASIERAMRIEANSPWLSLALAEVRLAQGDTRQAETLAQRARVQSGGDRQLKSKSWMVTAQARRQGGDVAGADDAVRRAGQ